MKIENIIAMIRIVIILIFSGITILGYTQNRSNINTIKGQVVEFVTQRPVPNAIVSIININKYI